MVGKKVEVMLNFGVAIMVVDVLNTTGPFFSFLLSAGSQLGGESGVGITLPRCNFRYYKWTAQVFNLRLSYMWIMLDALLLVNQGMFFKGFGLRVLYLRLCY